MHFGWVCWWTNCLVSWANPIVIDRNHHRSCTDNILPYPYGSGLHATKTNTMKASVCLQYGSPDVLMIREVAQPLPKAQELLVKVHATTVNRSDMGILHGTPRLMRGY